MAIATRNDVFTNIGKGLGFSSSFLALGNGSATTAGAAASGFFTAQLLFNSIGTTIPTTLVGFPLSPVPGSSILGVYGQMQTNSVRSLYLVRLYKFGTLDLTATGDKFTASGTTFPVTRTQFGTAAQPVGLIPVCYITTATSVTAPVFRLRTNAGVAGYKNQDGSTVVGTKTMTMPAAATAINSAFIIRVEDGDSAVQDITAIEVTTASTTGAATIFGAEILMPLTNIATAHGTTYDAVFGGLGMCDLNPAVETGGTAVTQYLAVLSLGSTGAITAPTLTLAGVVNA